MSNGDVLKGPTNRSSTKVTLEPRTAAHAQELFTILSDASLYEFMDDEPPASMETLRQRFTRAESRRSPDGTQHWLNWVVRDDSRRIVGYVQATVLDNLETNVAYVIGREYWGKGHAHAAVTQMLELVAREFSVAQFYIVAERTNARSLRLAERLGFRETAPEVAARKHVSANEILMERPAAAPST